MQLSSAQLAAAIRAAGLGDRLTAVTWLSARRYRAQLDGRPVVLTFTVAADRRSAAAGAVEHQALLRLRELDDERIPALIGVAALAGGSHAVQVTAQVRGRPYREPAAHLDERTRRRIGAELAELLVRVHALRGPVDGPLDGVEGRPQADYRLERAAAAAADWPAAERRQLIDVLRAAQPATAAVLVHGGLTPDRLLIEPSGGRWRLSGLVGWQSAQYWQPAWDHVCLQQHWAAAEDFGLRVGYGAAYDGLVNRPADQVREAALWPYRLIAWLEAGHDAAVRRHLSETVVLSGDTVSA
jgi:hypothetical protein